VLKQELVEVHPVWVLLLAILVVSTVASALIVVLQKASKEWSEHLLLIRWNCL